MSEADAATPSQSGAQQWLAKAAEDLGVAQLILDSANAARWAACFLAEQATEKALKAVLVATGTTFRGRTCSNSSPTCSVVLNS
jgi:HEPN domain-containing protein